MIKIHFIDGSEMNVGISFKRLCDFLSQYQNAKILQLDNMIIFIDKVVYIEELKNKEK